MGINIGKTLLPLALITLSFSNCSPLLSPKEIRIAGISFESPRRLLERNGTAISLRKSELAPYLMARANQLEFAVAYLPEEQLLLNLSLERSVGGVRFSYGIVDALIEHKKRFHIIHNHNNHYREKKEESPFYWIAPSIQDLNSHLELKERGGNFLESIVTENGLLTISTDSNNFKKKSEPFYFSKIILETKNIQTSLKGVKKEDLKTWAKNYKGLFALSFRDK